MYWHKKPIDPSCGKTHTGFVITFADVLILSKSQLQKKTALSTMEAKIIALLACCRDLFSIIDMVELLTISVNLPITMKLLVHENNLGVIVLAKTLLPQFTLQSKYTPSRRFGFVKKFTNVVSSY
jgi:hypothetical protein